MVFHSISLLFYKTTLTAEWCYNSVSHSCATSPDPPMYTEATNDYNIQSSEIIIQFTQCANKHPNGKVFEIFPSADKFPILLLLNNLANAIMFIPNTKYLLDIYQIANSKSQ